MTAPKPFPFPIGIGTDMCRVNRIAAILRHEYTRNRWARKIFTRLEWPALCERLQRVEKATGKPAGQTDEASVRKLEIEGQEITKAHDSSIWMLPRLSGYSSILEDENSCWSAIADERSALGTLARHLAGRWAAKEAVIKAHRHRQLYMQNISIVRPVVVPDSSNGTSTAGTQKSVALIDPPSDRVEMTPAVATRRGLRGFVLRNNGLYKGALMTRGELRKEVRDLEDSELHKGVHYYRGSRIKASDRQVAEINISHDGDYAIAMCMAFDPPESTVPEKTIVDKGDGLALHEPQWGDEGWLNSARPEFEGDLSGLERESLVDISVNDLLDEPEFPSNPDVLQKTVKDPEDTQTPSLL